MSVSDADTPATVDDAGDEPAAIERQIEATRSQLTGTLTELERRLSMRRLTDDLVESVRDAVMGPTDGSTDMIDMVRRNPVPAALVGIGLAWLVFGTPKTAKAAGSGNPTTDNRSDEPSGIGTRLADAAADRLDDARETAGALRGRTARFFEDSPLAVALTGLAVGGLLAALLPVTRRESAWIGDAQSRLVGQAGSLGREALERARAVAEAAGEAAMSAAQRELGLGDEKATGNGHDPAAAPERTRASGR